MGALTPDGVGEAGGAVDTEGGADSGVLELFHPLIREWFRDEVGTPTDVQSLAWPRIAAGEHVLVSAPTGSGKTLTAFLWALDRLFTGAWRPGRVRVLYVSPLRALNTDIRRNLTGPLDALRQRFEAADEPAPRLRAMTRSGDTPQNERRRMLRHPPEILVTTPESLNILLTSDSGRALLEGVEAVILDEIHALAGSKRGTHLITAVDRLVPLAGEFQRIALSATVRPMETVAELVAGHELIEGAATAGEAVYRPRRMSIVRAPGSKTYDVKVRYVADPDPEKEVEDDSVWAGLTRDFRRVIRRNRSTLLFANSRRSTEKITRFVNSAEGEELAYSHHGSLSREVRSVVEKRLKEGQLKAIVATNSLELGIDIGALDEVLLVQTPRAVSSAIQRVGRAGHGVGEVSRGVFYPTHGLDLLDAAVVARCVSRQEIEEVRPISGALDVLAQVILSMVSVQEWNVDELYDRVRASHPYRHLSRRHFDLVIEMLAGRYADSRVRELRPRLTYDRVKGGVKARPGTRRLIYMSGGTIADRGYFALRHQDTMAKIGDLDEEFVWERSVGDAFTLGAQSWQIRRITHNDVLVTPGRGPQAALAPFWRADAQDRGHFLCQETAAFLERAEGRLADSTFLDVLEEEYRLERPAAEALVEYLEEQRAATGGKLPRRDRLLVEHCGERFGASGSRAVILHTFWGGTVNRPLAMVLAAAWEERHGEPLEAFHDDHCLLVRLPGDLTIEELFAMAPPDQVEQLLRRRLESTGFFGARFRWAASTSLLLPKSGFRQRMPLWMNRQRSKKLQDSVQGYGDFPMLVETWRTCLYDELDLDQLKRQVGRVRDGELPLDHVSSGKPSPFAANLVWQHTNKYMYEDDTPDPGAAPGRASGLRQDVLQELVYASHLRPRLPVELVESFRRKVQRVSPGYAPRPGEDLGHWLGERLLLSGSEWRELVAAVAADAEIPAPEVAESTPVLTLRLPGAAESAVAAPEGAARVLRALGLEIDGVVLGHVDGVREAPSEAVSSLRALVDLGPVAADAGAGDDERAAAVAGLVAGLVAEWLRYHGPVTTAWAASLWGLEDDQLPELLDTLAETRSAVVDQMTLGTSEAEVCDAENLEILLRWLRMDRRPSFEARPAAELPLFLASRQGLVRRGDGVEDLQDRLERLFGLSLKAQLWEAEVLPARLDPYFPSWLDAAMQQSELTWLGTGSERATFGFDSDLDLFYDPGDGPGAEPAVGEARDDAEALGRLFVDPRAKVTLEELAARSDVDLEGTSDLLWRAAWAGRVSNDAWVAVRKGLETKFRPEGSASPAASGSSRGRSAARRGPRGALPRAPRRRGPRGAGWTPNRPFGGHWYLVEPSAGELDALEREELVKDRVRLLLQRYGILFRQLLTRELPALQWSNVFRTLRLMELSGEVLAGQFFEGVRGLQFIAHGAYRELVRGLSTDSIYWLCAADPASLCGVEVEGLKEHLPARLGTTHLVFHGTERVLVSKRRGRALEVAVGPDHPRLADYFGPLKHLLVREVQPLSSVLVETIGDDPASKSAYRRRFEQEFRVTGEGQAIRLWKRY